MQNTFRFRVLLALLLTISFLPDLLGSSLTDKLRREWGDYDWLLILTLGLLVISIVYLLRRKGASFFQKKSAAPQAVTQENIDKIREGLRTGYQERIRHKLASRYPVNIELKYSTEGSTTRHALYDNKTLKSKEVKDELVDLFEKHRGRLLITGQPGSGKTTLLIELAFILLQREDYQIPIIIDIATWRPRFSTVEAWLKELLPQMGFSKGLVEQLMLERRILPLFDGLDELPKEHRQTCLEAIAQFGTHQHAKYTISSRIIEYRETIDAPVYCQIMVKPLSLSQIKKSLKEVSAPETKGILDALQKDPLLAEAVETPFYLNTVQILFSTMRSWEEFSFEANSLVGRKQEIVELLVEEGLENSTRYSPDQSRKWLAFLADRMYQSGLLSFELVSLQYDWVHLSKRQFFVARLLYGLVTGLGFGLGLGLGMGIGLMVLHGLLYQIDGLVDGTFGIDELVRGLVIGLIEGFDGLVTGLYLGLGVGLLTRLPQKKLWIESKDQINWSYKGLREAFKRNLSTPPVIKISLAIVLGSLGIMLFNLLVYGPIVELVYVLVILVVFMLVIGLTLGLSLAVIDTMANNKSYLKIKQPSQRFKASMRVFYFSIIQHTHVRKILYRKGLLPKNLISFLDAITKQNLLESDGGSWRFRHRILQDYFSKHWKETYASDEALASDLEAHSEK